MADIIPSNLENYIYEHSSFEGETLAELERSTFTDVLMPQMLSGRVQGRLLSILSKIIRPQRILEIGTYTGYSAICMAEGLQNEGILYTIDINEELETLVSSFIKKAGFDSKIKCLIGDAAEIIPGLNETFDLVFIDADKANYSRYFDLIIDKVKSGGIILADNVLWSGKIVAEKKDKDTMALCDFNDKIQQDSRVENVIVSMRDGIMMMIKK